MSKMKLNYYLLTLILVNVVSTASFANNSDGGDSNRTFRQRQSNVTDNARGRGESLPLPSAALPLALAAGFYAVRKYFKR